MSETLQISRCVDEGVTQLALAGEFTIYAVAEVHAALAGAFDGAQGIRVDLSGIGEFDSSALQLLRAAGREAALRGIRFDVVGHPAPAGELCGLLGLTPAMSDAGEESSWT